MPHLHNAWQEQAWSLLAHPQFGIPLAAKVTCLSIGFFADLGVFLLDPVCAS